MHTFLLLLALPVSVFAQIEPHVERIAEGPRIEQMLNDAVSRATADLEERGTTMTLTYSSPAPMNVLILYLNSAKQFDPLDSLVVSLPAGTRTSAQIDLTKSTGWSPGTRTYRLHFLSTSEEGASFDDIEFSGSSFGATLLAGIKQLLSPLPYTPSSYHRIPSYTLFGIPLIPVFGFIVIAGTLLLLRRPQKAIIFTLALTLFLSARFSVDALRFTASHLSEWISQKTYATAGALPIITKDIQKEDVTGIYLCHTGTSYARRALAYYAYPIPIVQKNASHAVVHASTNWSYERGILRCGTDSFRAQKIKEYPDGSILFSLISQ